MADETKDGPGSAFEPAEKIESFLKGLLYFLQGLLFTISDLAFNKTRFSNTIKNPDTGREYTKPVTFITLMSFLAIRIFRFGLLTLLLGFSTASCETQTEIKYPSLLDELSVPSLEEIFLYGIPILIIALLFSQLLKFLLLKGSAESRQVLVSATYYGVGFQYIAYLVIFSLASLLFYWLDQDVETLIPEWVYGTVSIILLLYVLWVVFVFYGLVSKTIDKKDLRISTFGFKQLWLFLWSFVVMATTTISVVGITYYLIQPDYEELRAKPVISMGLIGSDNSNPDEFSVEVLVRNNSDEELALLTDRVTVNGSYVYPGRITDSNLEYEHVIILKPNEVCWLSIVFDKPVDAERPGPFSSSDLVRFVALNPAGESKSIRAYIRSEGREVFISEIE